MLQKKVDVSLGEATFSGERLPTEVRLLYVFQVFGTRQEDERPSSKNGEAKASLDLVVLVCGALGGRETGGEKGKGGRSTISEAQTIRGTYFEHFLQLIVCSSNDSQGVSNEWPSFWSPQTLAIWCGENQAIVVFDAEEDQPEKD